MHPGYPLTTADLQKKRNEAVNGGASRSPSFLVWVCRCSTSLAVVVVLTLPRIIKSVVTGQAPVTLELRNTPGKNTHTQPKVVHAYITADAIHASTRNI